MDNFELEIFSKIMKYGSFVSNNENNDNQLYNLQLQEYIKLHILPSGKLFGKRIFNRKTIALANQLNIKVEK